MAEKKAALLIANFEYDDPYFRQLKAPEQDVKALSRVLGDPAIGGFCDVKTLLNEPKDGLILAIEEFFDDRNRDDLLLVYFSCHGIKDEDGRLYYATKNTKHKRLVATAVPAYQVNDLIGKSRSRRKILLLDCCYSGAFSKAFLSKGDVAVGVMEEFRQGQGLVTITASDAFQYSFEGAETGDSGAYSVFTRALVEGIETGKADLDGDQLISLDELYDYAYERVHSENPLQTPRIQVDVEGKIIVARNPQPPRPAQLPPELEDAIESPFVGNREYAVRQLDILLRGRNKALAIAAHEALTKLKGDDSRKVASAVERCLIEEQQRISQENLAVEGKPGERTDAVRTACEKAEQKGPEEVSAGARGHSLEHCEALPKADKEQVAAKASGPANGELAGPQRHEEEHLVREAEAKPEPHAAVSQFDSPNLFDVTAPITFRKRVMMFGLPAIAVLGILIYTLTPTEHKSDPSGRIRQASAGEGEKKKVVEQVNRRSAVDPLGELSKPDGAGEGEKKKVVEQVNRRSAIDPLGEPSKRPPAVAPLPQAPTPQRIRVGGNVQAANLIRTVKPTYPPLAKQSRIQGTVHFTAIIGKDGTIQNLQLVSGHPFLVEAAAEAVKQWVYRPTLMNGEPVEVITQIDVNFTLSM
jgi:TonB family protein